MRSRNDKSPRRGLCRAKWSPLRCGVSYAVSRVHGGLLRRGSNIDAEARARGMAVVYPQALKDKTGRAHWNANMKLSRRDDVGYLSALVAHLVPSHGFDPARVFVAGESNGGYMVYTEYSFRNVFQYEAGDVYWCTADIGWITGHSYIVYGPLLAGATTMMFEGVPTFPDAGRFWDVCDKYKVNQFYTAPTAIRALMALGDDFVDRADLHSLKVIGSVGEPINAEAWYWYHEKVGRGRCPIVDTWWQTETGGIMISGLGGHSPQRATFAGLPLPGIQPVLLDGDGNEIEGDGVEGYLCVKHPWPSMLRTTYGDHERCKNTYFSNYDGYYFTGDGARREDGMFRIIGRVDDVINVSGHRFGTAEIENAINASSVVTESAVVGYPHDIKGQGIYAYVILEDGEHQADEVRKAIISTLVEEIGPIAKPDIIQIVPGLPKTRSGKIMRRILRKVAEGDTSNLGDTSTLLDPSVVETIKADALALRS